MFGLQSDQNLFLDLLNLFDALQLKIESMIYYQCKLLLLLKAVLNSPCVTEACMKKV